MGEASAGRSATTPTFFKSTSVRTRMEWQYSHVVCTALDQRNVTGAPQFGQFAVTLMPGTAARSGALARGWRRNALATRLRNQPADAAGSKRRSDTTSRTPER